MDNVARSDETPKESVTDQAGTEAKPPRNKRKGLFCGKSGSFPGESGVIYGRPLSSGSKRLN